MQIVQIEYPDEKKEEENKLYIQNSLSSLLLLNFTCLTLACI